MTRRRFLAAVAALPLAVAGCPAKKASSPAESHGPTNTLRTREELAKELMGKPMDFVRVLLGRPSFESDEPEGIVRWGYEGVCRDAATGKTDPATNVFFKDQKVVRVPPG